MLDIHRINSKLLYILCGVEEKSVLKGLLKLKNTPVPMNLAKNQPKAPFNLIETNKNNKFLLHVAIVRILV